MRKILGFIAIFVLLIASMFMQSNVLNKVQIFGVVPNALLVMVITIALWYGLRIGTVFGFVAGIIADNWFSTSLNKYLILFTLVAILVGYFNENYKKENIITLMYLSVTITAIYEFIVAIGTVFVTKNMFNIFLLLKVVIIACVLNLILASILYYVLAYICNKIEDLIAEDRW